MAVQYAIKKEQFVKRLYAGKLPKFTLPTCFLEATFNLNGLLEIKNMEINIKGTISEIKSFFKVVDISSEETFNRKKLYRLIDDLDATKTRGKSSDK